MPGFRIPRFAPAAGRCFNRSRFLDGTYKTYFAPHQDPGVIGRYKPPTDWRPAGGILTPPQVVWLTVCAIDGNIPTYREQFTNGIYQVGHAVTTTSSGGVSTTTDNYYFADGAVVAVSTIVNDGLHSTTTFASSSKYVFVDPEPGGAATIIVRDDRTDPPSFDLSGPPASYFPGELEQLKSDLAQCPVVYDEAVPNLMFAQRARLLALFRGVADQIQSIRPGKTWVRVNDLSAGSDQAYDFDPCASYAIAPDSTEGPFFGVDFLHLHALAYSFGGSPPTDDFAYPGAGFVPDDADTRLGGASKRFVRYSCRLYGPDGTYPAFPDVPPIPFAPAGGAPGGGNGAFVEALNQQRKSVIDGWNRQLAARNPGVVATLQSEASALQPYGVSYAGPESDLSDVATVAGVIASHFRFDPSTGADLPARGQ